MHCLEVGLYSGALQKVRIVYYESFNFKLMTALVVTGKPIDKHFSIKAQQNAVCKCNGSILI